MNLKNMLTIFGVAALLSACGQGGQKDERTAQNEDFHYLMDEFADLKVMRYQEIGRASCRERV